MKKGAIVALVIVIIGAAAAVTGIVITGKNGSENASEQASVDSGADAQVETKPEEKVEPEEKVSSASSAVSVDDKASGAEEDTKASAADEVIEKDIDTDGFYYTSLSTAEDGKFDSIGYGTIMDYTLDVDSFVCTGSFIYGKDQSEAFSVSPDKVSDDNKLKKGKYTFKLSPSATFYTTDNEGAEEESNAERFESMLADNADSQFSLYITVTDGEISEMKIEQ